MATHLDSIIVEGTARSTLQGPFLGVMYGTTMPPADEESRDIIVLYMGAETALYRPFTFYRCAMGANDVWQWSPCSPRLDTLAYLQEHAVPDTRKVNGHALDKDVHLTYSDVDALPANTHIPTKVSELSNDAVYVTQDVSTLSNYWTKPQTSKILSTYLKMEFTDVLPDAPDIDENRLYSVPEGDTRKVYYRHDGAWFPL